MNYRTLILTLLLTLTLMPHASARKQQKNIHPLRVACVGNSVTYGYGLADRDHDAYPVRLQAMLNSKYGEGNFEVGNFGHSGATLLTRGHRPYIKVPEFRQALDFRPDWVVIHLGLNDTDPRNWPDWKEEFVPDYRALIDSFLMVNPEARILVCKMTPIFDRHPRFQSGTRDWHAQIQQAIETVAYGAKAQLVDLYTPLHSRPDLFPDALHPNPEGAEILAQTVYAALSGDYGGLRLPRLYGNGMVLQRDEPTVLHGRADALQLISITLKKDGKIVNEAQTLTREDGTWQIETDSHEAGGPYSLTVTAEPKPAKYNITHYPERYPVSLSNLRQHAKQTITIDSIYFGDVWLASGQSNMELRVNQCNSMDADLADAARLASRLHLYNMPARARTDAVEWPDSVLAFTNELQHMDFQGWSTATPESVARFSAVAFNFGRLLADSLTNVHIGIICNAVGGSTTESWVDRTTLEYEIPNILNYWRLNDYGQEWARRRTSQNIAKAIAQNQRSLQRHPYDPCYLFEAAIAPLEHVQLKGVIWYQGESNANNVELHEQLFRLLVRSWRKEFSQTWQSHQQRATQLPFYFVQLSSLPRPSWPAFRDSQRRLAETLPDTWMAVTTDLGDKADVHYTTKRPVGERLALQALNHTYGRPVVSEGPVLTKATLKDAGTKKAAVVLSFKNDDGLTATRGFEIAGRDGIFHHAKIEIQGRTIRLSSDKVAWPTTVRYGWSGYTDADLHNAQGLPASTFMKTITL